MALHPREITRHLTDMVLALSGAVLADDATLLVLDWHGGHGNNRHTTAGADQLRASTASTPPASKGDYPLEPQVGIRWDPESAR